MRIEEIMTRNVETVNVLEPAERAWHRMRDRRIHHLVVVDRGKVLGIVSDRDMGGERGSALRRGQTVADRMTPFAVTATPKTTIRQAANLLRGYAIGCLPVVEPGGRLVGIVTVSDLLGLIGRGAERPVAKTKRWTLKHRGPRSRTQCRLRGD
jgi:acetoin utilization protein AcuB